jgi:hypothetical protein
VARGAVTPPSSTARTPAGARRACARFAARSRRRRRGMGAASRCCPSPPLAQEKIRVTPNSPLLAMTRALFHPPHRLGRSSTPPPPPRTSSTSWRAWSAARRRRTVPWPASRRSQRPTAPPSARSGPVRRYAPHAVWTLRRPAPPPRHAARTFSARTVAAPSRSAHTAARGPHLCRSLSDAHAACARRQERSTTRSTCGGASRPRPRRRRAPTRHTRTRLRRARHGSCSSAPSKMHRGCRASAMRRGPPRPPAWWPRYAAEALPRRAPRTTATRRSLGRRGGSAQTRPRRCSPMS